MSAAVSALRRRLEELVPTPPVESRGLGTGIAALDALLPMRGLPRGKLTEIRGQKSSGITTVLRHTVAFVSQNRLVAYVDARRTLAAIDWMRIGDAGLGIKSGKREMGNGKRTKAGSNPQSPNLNSHQHLWIIRPPVAADSHWCTDVLLRSGAFALVVLDGAPPLSRSTSARLIRLARETGTALVVAGETEPGVVGAAVRMVVGKPREAGKGKRETGTGIGGKRAMGNTQQSGRGRTNATRITPNMTRLVGAPPFPVSRFPFPCRLVITIEKGGIRRGIEVEYAIGLEDRLCAHPAVGDRRGAAWSGSGKREAGSGSSNGGTGEMGAESQGGLDSRFPIPDHSHSPLGPAPDRPRLRRRPRAAGVAGGDANGDPGGDDGDGGPGVMRRARSAPVG